MARPKQKHFIPPQTLFGLLITVGALALVAKLLQNSPSGSRNAIGLVILIVIVAAVAFPIIRSLVVSALPGTAIDALLAAQFGPLSLTVCHHGTAYPAADETRGVATAAES